MAVKEGPDVIGYDCDLARALLEEQGLTVSTKYVGKSLGSGLLRVIRQRVDQEGTVELTCSPENWQANRQ